MTWQTICDPLSSGRLCMTLVHSLWQVALFAAIAWGLGRLWRRSIERSYALHVAALIAGLAAMPVTYALIDVNVSGTARQSEFALDATLPLAPPAAWSLEDSRSLVDEGEQAPKTQDSPAIPDAPAPTPVTAAAREPSALWLQAAPWIVAFYLTGVVFMLVRLIGGTWRANRLGSKAELIGDGALVERLNWLARKWSMRIVPALAQAEGVVVPKVVGLVRPIILLPVSLITCLSTDELEMILAHELAHVRRYDVWVNLAQRVAEVVLFFNPALWYLSRRTSALREYCCDELTCRTISGSDGELRTRYASALLRIVELGRQGAARGARARTLEGSDLAALAAAGRSPSDLRRRIARLFGEPLREPVRLSRGGLLMLGVLIAVLLVAPTTWHSAADTESAPTTTIDEDHEANEAAGKILPGKVLDDLGSSRGAKPKIVGYLGAGSALRTTRGRFDEVVLLEGYDPLMERAVVKELNITAEQKGKLRALQFKHNADTMRFFQQRKDMPQDEVLKAITQWRQQQWSDIRKRAEEILTPTQIKKLNEYACQVWAFQNLHDSSSKILGELGVTAEQQDKLRTLWKEINDRARQDLQGQIDRLLAVLNLQQRAQLRDEAFGPDWADSNPQLAIEVGGDIEKIYLPGLSPYPDFTKEDVRQELGLSAKQQNQVRDLLGGASDLAERLVAEWRKLSPAERKKREEPAARKGGGGASASSGVSAEKLKKWEAQLENNAKKARREDWTERQQDPLVKANAQLVKQFEAILTPPQLARYKEMAFRYAVAGGLVDEIILRKVGASDRQIEALVRLSDDYVENFRRLMREMGAKTLKILTTAQQEKVREEVFPVAALAPATPSAKKAPAAAETRPVDTAGQESLLILNVDKEGIINVNGRTVPLEKYIAREAEASLLRARRTQPGLQFGQELPTTVEIRADRTMPFRLLNRVITECQQNGFRKLALKTMNKEDSRKASSEEDSRVDLAVVVARHVLLLDGKEITTWAELEKKIAALPDPSQAYPHFYITRGAYEAGVEKKAKEEMWRLHQKFKLKGHSEGSLLPRADFRYDAIKTAKDLVPDESLRVKGRVVDGKGGPAAGAEVLLVTPVDKSIPYQSYDVALVQGRVRNPLEEVMTHSDAQGQFSLYPPKGVSFYVVAIHPKAGFNLARSSQFTTTGEVRLLAWATLVSKFAEEAGERQEASLRTRVRETDGFPEIVLTQYWVDLKQESPTDEFRFTHVPPIFDTTISRDFRGLQGVSFGLPGATVGLMPGESRRLDLGPLSDKQREHLEWLRKESGARREAPTTVNERAIAGGLNWLARHQLPDGKWSFHTMPGSCKCSGAGTAHCDVAATALAVLSFLGAGVTHKNEGPYQSRVQRGIDWLMLHQDRASGDLAKGSPQHMYEHGIATLALCEAYGMSKDLKIREPAAQALRFIQAAQNEATGGWGNERGNAGDTAVTAWQVMALRSGQLAGLGVEARSLENARKWLASVHSGEGLFQSRPGDSKGVTPAMTAAGMLCQQYLGMARDAPAMRGSQQYLMEHLPDADRERNVSYWYFATMAMHNIMGPEWDRWNRPMRKTLIQTQAKGSCAEGSWDADKPTADPGVSQGGRLMATSLSVLTLEVYYRYLPLHKLNLLPYSPKASTTGGASAGRVRPAQLPKADAGDMEFLWGIERGMKADEIQMNLH